jgi:hypothetical protein
VIALTPTPGTGSSVTVAVAVLIGIGPEHSPTGTMSGFVLLLKALPVTVKL